MRWLVDHDLRLPPEDVTTPLLRRWVVEVIETRSAATARTRWDGLRSFFAWCLAEGEIPANPTATVTAPALPEKLVQYLALEQLRDVIAACQGPLLVDRRSEALILAYADTGLRLSELALAEVANLDLRARTLLVTGKGRRERVVPFGARTARALDRYLRLRESDRHSGHADRGDTSCTEYSHICTITS